MTTTIIGKGPSLLTLTRDEVPPGRVIALNQAIVHVRRLGLSNQIFTMQRDGCVAQDWRAAPIQNLCGHCPAGDMIMPQHPEILIVTRDTSPYCFADYSPRMVLGSFDLPWYTMSSPIAVLVAQSWGETDLFMVAHDSYTGGNTQYVNPDGSFTDHPHGGYHNAGAEAARFAELAGMTVAWRA